MSRVTVVTPSGAWIYSGGWGKNRCERFDPYAESPKGKGEEGRNHSTGACGLREQTPEGGADTHSDTKRALVGGWKAGTIGTGSGRAKVVRTISRRQQSPIKIPNTEADKESVRRVHIKKKYHEWSQPTGQWSVRSPR